MRQPGDEPAAGDQHPLHLDLATRARGPRPTASWRPSTSPASTRTRARRSCPSRSSRSTRGSRSSTSSREGVRVDARSAHDPNRDPRAGRPEPDPERPRRRAPVVTPETVSVTGPRVGRRAGRRGPGQRPDRAERSRRRPRRRADARRRPRRPPHAGRRRAADGPRPIAVFSDAESRPLPVTPVVSGTPAAGYEVDRDRRRSVDRLGRGRCRRDPRPRRGARRSRSRSTARRRTSIQNVGLALPEGVQPAGGQDVTVRVTVTIEPVAATPQLRRRHRPGRDARRASTTALDVQRDRASSAARSPTSTGSTRPSSPCSRRSAGWVRARTWSRSPRTCRSGLTLVTVDAADGHASRSRRPAARPPSAAP